MFKIEKTKIEKKNQPNQWRFREKTKTKHLIWTATALSRTRAGVSRPRRCLAEIGFASNPTSTSAEHQDADGSACRPRKKIGGRMNRRRCPWCATVAGGRNQNLYISSENFIFLPFFWPLSDPPLAYRVFWSWKHHTHWTNVTSCLIWGHANSDLTEPDVA
jgi:hypothetical protein